MNEELIIIRAELWTKVYVHYLGAGKDSYFASGMAHKAVGEYNKRFIGEITVSQ